MQILLASIAAYIGHLIALTTQGEKCCFSPHYGELPHNSVPGRITQVIDGHPVEHGSNDGIII